MDSLKGSQIALVRKEDCVPYSIYFEGLKGSKLTLLNFNNVTLICLSNVKKSGFKRKQLLYLKINLSFPANIGK
ncbi:hypothetical protein JHK85_004789 [Glycine max]|uniref:Uncharacterized protein n=2 Tax=Glycine subgen. Soja TaxID=1462606 RepID=A0A0R0KXW4_SOYBN|nr:hypothetical protein JHK87_004452 [Glycine soja]KAG5063606.1 hypothetical protein JHK85_004789 [Glycine max]KAG5080551.1 hypothetical protein JHK86_004616 [Glycine max]KAH1060926.1 hypothetical protein GYH30_004417 [Glycine max]